MGQCHGRAGGCIPSVATGDDGWWHSAHCPALYSLQRQPGDEKDALTRLARHVREAHAISHAQQTATQIMCARGAWLSSALDLISEAREEHKKAVAFAWAQQRALESELTKQREATSEWAEAAARAEHDLAKTMDALLTTQKRMGEVRQQAMREAREELASLSNEAAIDQLQFIRDISEDR